MLRWRSGRNYGGKYYRPINLVCRPSIRGWAIEKFEILPLSEIIGSMEKQDCRISIQGSSWQQFWNLKNWWGISWYIVKTMKNFAEWKLSSNWKSNSFGEIWLDWWPYFDENVLHYCVTPPGGRIWLMPQTVLLDVPLNGVVVTAIPVASHTG